MERNSKQKTKISGTPTSLASPGSVCCRDLWPCPSWVKVLFRKIYKLYSQQILRETKKRTKAQRQKKGELYLERECEKPRWR